MKNRNQKLFILVLLAIAFAVVIYLTRTGQVNVTDLASGKKTLLYSNTQIPPKEAASGKQKPPAELPKKDCVSSTLETIASKCDKACLFNHVRRKDPELLTIMNELKQLPINPKTKIGKFYYAFFGMEADPAGRKKALRELVALDSDNSYPFFFLGDLMLNHKEAEAKGIFEEGLRRKNYESYFTQYFRRLKKATIDRPEVYAQAIIFNRDLSIHQLNNSILWGLREFDEALAKKVALKILKPTFDLKGEYGDILWSREDYLMTRHMLASLDSTEDSLYPEYDVEEMVLEKYSPGLIKECNVKAFLEERDRERERLSSIK